VHWQHYWDCEPCSYPDRTGDLRSVVKISDFYSERRWHSTGMYRDLYRLDGSNGRMKGIQSKKSSWTVRPQAALARVGDHREIQRLVLIDKVVAQQRSRGRRPSGGDALIRRPQGRPRRPCWQSAVRSRHLA
jgi:hypothetical protein